MSVVAPSGSQRQQTLSFEFTKRKRWADLLISELAGAIILVLSSKRKILFCGTATNDLLGWKDEELVDWDLVEFMNADDQVNFRSSYEECLRTRNELLSYARLRCKTHLPAGTEVSSAGPKEILFELKGYPHFIPEQDTCKCFFLMAKPYPSRNMAMLNTFLELKMENERLQQRVKDLKAQPPQFHTPSETSIFNTSSLPNSLQMPMIASSQASSTLWDSSPYPGYSLTPAGLGTDMLSNSSPIHSTLENGAGIAPYGGIFSGLSGSETREDVVEDDVTKKKPKKSHSSEQYVCVTCGRTDSPEWRKGPLGPKTLCNACGLRWAKQMRKFDDGMDGDGEALLAIPT